MGCGSTRAQVRHAAPVVFPVGFDCRARLPPSSPHKCLIGDSSGDNAAKEEHGSDSGSESLDKHKPRDILHCHVERRDRSFAVAERAER